MDNSLEYALAHRSFGYGRVGGAAIARAVREAWDGNIRCLVVTPNDSDEVLAFEVIGREGGDLRMCAWSGGRYRVSGSGTCLLSRDPGEAMGMLGLLLGKHLSDRGATVYLVDLPQG